jgi:integrase
VTFLADPEIDALLAAPDRTSWLGRRDHALLLLAIQTGLRVSELTSLRRESTRTTDIYLHADLALKEKALARTTAPNTRAGRYQAPDSLLAFLKSLRLCRARGPPNLLTAAANGTVDDRFGITTSAA